MNTKQILVAGGLLVAALVVFGFWASKTTPLTPVVEEAHALQGAINPETQEYEYREETNFYTIEAHWPSKVPLPTAEASAEARLAIERMLAARIAEFKANGNFDALTAEDIATQGLDGTRKYALSLEFTDYVWDNGHSYAYTVYEDTLGAHPNAYYMTKVFDLEGNEVALGDLLAGNPNWLEELSLVVSNGVMAELKSRLGSSAPQGPEGPDVSGLVYPEGLAPKIENFANFVVHENNLIILIPPYQVAAYAAGSFEVKVPLNELR